MAERELAAALVVDDVDLVEGDHARPVVGADLLEDLVDRPDHLRQLIFGEGGVDHVHHEVGAQGLLERRPERVHQLVRELADEADGVGQQKPPAADLEAPGERVERMEQAVVRAGVRARQCVEERRLAGVRVSGEGDARELRTLALAAHDRAVPPGAVQAAPQRRDPVAR